MNADIGPCRIARRSTAVVLAVIVAAIGVPLPASAGSDETLASARHLTLNGEPLSRFVGTAASVRGRVPLPGLLEQESGQISGIALDAEGQPLADHSVELRVVSEQGGLTYTSIEATTTTDARGGFSFPGLGPGRYVVAVTTNDQVATTEPIRVADGGMAFVEVGRAESPAREVGGGLHPVAWFGIVAGAMVAFLAISVAVAGGV